MAALANWLLTIFSANKRLVIILNLIEHFWYSCDLVVCVILLVFVFVFVVVVVVVACLLVVSICWSLLANLVADDRYWLCHCCWWSSILLLDTTANKLANNYILLRYIAQSIT